MTETLNIDFRRPPTTSLRRNISYVLIWKCTRRMFQPLNVLHRLTKSATVYSHFAALVYLKNAIIICRYQSRTKLARCDLGCSQTSSWCIPQQVNISTKTLWTFVYEITVQNNCQTAWWRHLFKQMGSQSSSHYSRSSIPTTTGWRCCIIAKKPSWYSSLS